MNSVKNNFEMFLDLQSTFSNVKSLSKYNQITLIFLISYLAVYCYRMLSVFKVLRGMCQRSQKNQRHSTLQ